LLCAMVSNSSMVARTHARTHKQELAMCSLCPRWFGCVVLCFVFGGFVLCVVLMCSLGDLLTTCFGYFSVVVLSLFLSFFLSLSLFLTLHICICECKYDCTVRGIRLCAFRLCCFVM